MPSIHRLFPHTPAGSLLGVLTTVMLGHAACTVEDPPVVEDRADLAPLDDGDLGSQDSLASVEAAATCTQVVTPSSQLMITSLPVVEDAVRTRWSGATSTAADGAWHFGRLMTQMAGTHDPSTFVLDWLKLYEVPQMVNGDSVSQRPLVRRDVIDAWPKLASGKLDLTKAPMRLVAIVNRFDERSAGNAGVVRFVYGLLSSSGSPKAFTIAIDYKVPAANAAEVKAWAHQWRDLGALTPGSATYRAKLQSITDRVTRRSSAPGSINNTAFHRLRTNEDSALSFGWELREHALNSAGKLALAPVDMTPADRHHNSSVLPAFIRENATAIASGNYTIPLTYKGQPFQAGAVPLYFQMWDSPAFTDNNMRHRFSLRTCEGCHGVETATSGFQLSNRLATNTTSVSTFLTGKNAPDPKTGQMRSFNELARRANILKSYLCANP